MVRKFILCLCFVLVLLPIVAAVDTDITIKAEPYQNIVLRVLASGTDDTIETLYPPKTDGGGMTHVNFTSGFRNLNFLALIVKDKQIMDSKKFSDSYAAGKPVYLEFVKEKIQEVVNITNNESETEKNGTENVPIEENVKAENVENNSLVSGDVISEVGGNYSKFVYYVLGGLVGLLIVLFIVKKIYKGNDSPVLSKPISKKYKDEGREIQRIEKKIKEAQRELNMIKNNDRIKLAEAKLEADRIELEKLRKGDF